MAEKPKNHTELLGQIDVIVEFLLETTDSKLSIDKKKELAHQKLRNLRMLFDICDKEDDIYLSVEGAVLRLKYLNGHEDEEDEEVIHEFSLESIGFMDWMSDMSVDQSVQSARQAEAMNIFLGQELKGEGCLPELKNVLSELFESSDGQNIKMKTRAEIEMTRRRVEKTGANIEPELRGDIETAYGETHHLFEDESVDWNAPGAMAHFLSLVANRVTEKSTNQ